MQCLGAVFLIIGIFLFLFKTEESQVNDQLSSTAQENLTIKETYRVLLNILKLPAIKKLLGILLLVEVIKMKIRTIF